MPSGSAQTPEASDLPRGSASRKLHRGKRLRTASGSAAARVYGWGRGGSFGGRGGDPGRPRVPGLLSCGVARLWAEIAVAAVQRQPCASGPAGSDAVVALSVRTRVGGSARTSGAGPGRRVSRLLAEPFLCSHGLEGGGAGEGGGCRGGRGGVPRGKAVT